MTAIEWVAGFALILVASIGVWLTVEAVLYFLEAEVTHDELCPAALDDPGDTVRSLDCSCYLINKVRADERIRLTRDEGWFTDEAHEAVVATAKVRSERYTLERVRERVFELQEEAWIEYRGAVPGDVEKVALMCAMIESYKTIINIIDEGLE